MSEIPAQAAGRQVTDLSTLSTIAGDDYLIIHDATDSKLKKILADRFQSMVKFTTLASLKAATGYTLGQPAWLSLGDGRSGVFELRSGAPGETAGDYQGVELTYAGNASYHWHRIYSKIVDVIWFSDGTTVNTAAITRAIDYVTLRGGSAHIHSVASASDWNSLISLETASASDIADVSSNINTIDKRRGKAIVLYASNYDIILFASGTAAADAWKYGDGTIYAYPS